MRKRFFEDFIINKLNGYYLILYGHEYRFTSELVFRFTRVVVACMVFSHLIPPRYRP